MIGFAVGSLVAVLALPSRGREEVRGSSEGGDAAEAAATGNLPGDRSAVGGGAGASASGPDNRGAEARGTRGTGIDAAGGVGEAAGQGATSSSGGAAAPAASGEVRGVTDDAVTIGVALLDLGALRNLGPAFDNGDRKAHYESILAAWKRDGLVPVHGRDVRFVYRSYGPTSPEEQRAACRGLVQDEKVFAVMGDSQFQAGIDCVGREFRTPLVTSDAPTDEAVFQRGHPFVFTLQMSTWRLLRNYVHWADRKGYLTDRTIGLYYLNDPFQREFVAKVLKPELRRLGYKVTVEHSTDQNLGGPQDAVAVQRFRAADVDLAMLFTSKAGFMQQAEAQQYKPRYLESDFLSGTTNTATSTYPREQFDGTLAISGMRFGEWKAGMPAPPEAEACVANYAEASGQRIDANEREAEYIALNKACDGTSLVIDALQQAGRGLTPQTLIGPLERLQRDMGVHGPVAFSPTKHHGVDVQRTLRWSADCSCWRALGSFEPLFVP